jgi:hypothetical protein
LPLFFVLGFGHGGAPFVFRVINFAEKMMLLRNGWRQLASRG